MATVGTLYRVSLLDRVNSTNSMYHEGSFLRATARLLSIWHTFGGCPTQGAKFGGVGHRGCANGQNSVVLQETVNKEGSIQASVQ